MEVAQRSSKRKTVARIAVPNPMGSPVMNLRSRARKQATVEKPVDPKEKEEVSPVQSFSRKTQMPRPAFESTRIELASPVEQPPASPEKRGYEEDVPIKNENKKDISVQVSLCRNCDTGGVSLFRFLKPFFMMFVLMIVTLYCKDIVSIDSLKEYASSIETPSTAFARLKLDEFLDIFGITQTVDDPK